MYEELGHENESDDPDNGEQARLRARRRLALPESRPNTEFNGPLRFNNFSPKEGEDEEAEPTSAGP